jgi:hypothetical protein
MIEDMSTVVSHLRSRLSCGDPLGEWLGHLAIMNTLRIPELPPKEHLFGLKVYESYLLRSNFEERHHLLSQVRACMSHQEEHGSVMLLEGVSSFPSAPFRRDDNKIIQQRWKPEFEKIREEEEKKNRCVWIDSKWHDRLSRQNI